MPKNKRDIWALSIVIALALLTGGCQGHGKLRAQQITHLAVGQSTALAAYQEQHPSSLFRSAQAVANEPVTRSPVSVNWTVSDASIASINDAGILTGIKSGTVTLKGVWAGQEVSTSIQIADNLPTNFLPALSTQGEISNPNEVKLSLGKDRTLRFHAGFDNPQDEVTLEQQAPEQQLPWKFAYAKGTIELTSAAGMVLTGEVWKNDGGILSFRVWSDDEGTYPISLKGKTLMLVGDSMAEGLGWSLRGKVEAAGGHFVSDPWESSSTIGWQGERRMAELVARYHPDIVFIALGSNEIFVPNVQSRGAAVRQISQEIGDRPGYWIGPPSWRPDQGIVHVIEENFRPGHFYNSNDLKVPRRKDGAHPTVAGFKTWADLVWEWYARTG